MRLGDIEFRWDETNQKHELIRWYKPENCIVVAFFDRSSEGYDMRTVGSRFFADDNAWIVAKHAIAFLDAIHQEEEAQ